MTATLATRHNSRFARVIPRLAGISTGKTRTNNSDDPTSGSYNFPVRTQIHANFISLESRLPKLSNGTLHDPFWAPKDLQKLPWKSGQKTVQAHELRRIFRRGRMTEKITMWQLHTRHSLTMSRASSRCATCVAHHHFARTSAMNWTPLPLFQQIELGLLGRFLV